jgi:hypothetical protein
MRFNARRIAGDASARYRVMDVKACGLPVSPTDRPGRTGCEAARFDVLVRAFTFTTRQLARSAPPVGASLRRQLVYKRNSKNHNPPMDLDDEFRRILSGARDDDDGTQFRRATADALKRNQLSLREPRKPGANKPRKTMLPVATARDPARTDRLVRLHYALSLRDPGGRDPRIGAILAKIASELERLRGPELDSAPIKDISRVKPSGWTLTELQLAAQSLIELLTPVANGELPGREEQRAVEAGLCAFELAPGECWIVVVLREIERERRELSRQKIARGETADLEQSAQSVLERVRTQIGASLPSHVDVALLKEILGKYGFHSAGGRRCSIVGRRRATRILRDCKAGARRR